MDFRYINDNNGISIAIENVKNDAIISAQFIY